MINFALEYAAQGWLIFPLYSMRKSMGESICSCGDKECISPGKHPRILKGVKGATTDQSQIRAWWTKWPSANIGMACGKESGVFAIDVDTDSKKKGAESLASLEAEYGSLPITRESKTGSGGRHLFFYQPDGYDIKNRPIDKKKYPNIDIRTNGGYVVLPPSNHESGQNYEWVGQVSPVSCPEAILDVIAPKKKSVMPWEKKETNSVTAKPPVRTSQMPQDTSVMGRAALYLRECEPSVDGQAGGNALLWAARALVIGFELSDSDALSMLWSEFNPRCSPIYDQDNPKHRQQYEHKVKEARTVPFDKSSGWLLNECGLRSDKDALASMLGNQFAESYTKRVYKHAVEDPDEIPAIEDDPPSPGFPLHCFPPCVREYIELVSDVQVVDPAGVALSILVTAGAAMGNAYRLRLKGGFDVPPVLWGAIISSSGSNKSGPFREMVKPLRIDVPLEKLEHRIRNPQGQLLIEDATTEAVLGVLEGSPRGLVMANGEGAGWIGAFDRYSQGSKKKVSVDETIWLKLWDCDTYQKNRKTDSENVLIHNASCGVLVCIQPKKMAECFDPAQFASGLVPRLLVVYLPKQFRGWSEREMTEEDSLWWKSIIMQLRSAPFAEQDPNTGEYFPNIIMPSMTAKECYVAEFNRIAKDIEDADEMSELFLGKAQGVTGRIALVLHGLGAACGLHKIDNDLSEQTMLSGIEMMQYLVNQQLDVYNLAGENYAKRRIAETLAMVKNKGGSMKARDLQRTNIKKWPHVGAAVRDLERLAEVGFGEWDPAKKTFTVKEGSDE